MKLLHLLTLLFVGFFTMTAASRCPPKIKVQNRKPTCRDDYDCRKYYQICCPNAYNALSCTYPRDHFHSSSKSYSSQAQSIWKDCNGVKYMPYEVCRPDRHTGKLRCQLP